MEKIFFQSLFFNHVFFFFVHHFVPIVLYLLTHWTFSNLSETTHLFSHIAPSNGHIIAPSWTDAALCWSMYLFHGLLFLNTAEHPLKLHILSLYLDRGEELCLAFEATPDTVLSSSFRLILNVCLVIQPLYYCSSTNTANRTLAVCGAVLEPHDAVHAPP